MDFEFTEKQKKFQDAVIQFSKNLSKEYDKDEGFSREMWRRCADFGLIGLSVDNKYCGMGEDYLTSIIAMEALGYGCEDNGFVFAISNHLWVCQNLIYKYGSESLKEKYLEDMITGNLIGAYALTECTSGSDSFSINTNAEKKGDKYILNGNKIFISNGPIADVFIILAVTDHNSVIGGMTAFVVDKSFNGLNIGKEIKKMGLNSCPMCEINLDNCEVPISNILGKLGSGTNIINLALEWERCFEFASHVGAMQRLMEKCVAYTNERVQFGKKISEFQSVTNKIADMKVKIELSKLLLYKIGWMKNKNKRAFVDSAILKLFVSESYVKTALDTLQIHGAYGYAKEFGIEEEVRDSIASTIYSGTSEIQRNIIFRMIDNK